MARRKFEKTFNTFVGGLNTEASGLNFPENTSLYDKNFLLRTDGGRDRRKGMGVMGPMGMALTSMPYPIDAGTDTTRVMAMKPSVRRKIAAYYIPPEVSSVEPLPPSVYRRPLVKYFNYSNWPPETVSCQVLEPSVSRVVKVVQYSYSGLPESVSVLALEPGVFREKVADRFSYTGEPELVSCTMLTPTVNRRLA